MKPNLFIIGVAKAGTTSLYHLLKQHPDIEMSSLKEPHFFLEDYEIATEFTPRVDKLDEYLKLWSEDDQFLYKGEASPSYCWSRNALKKIKSFSPDSKCLLILRDPIQRIFSHYHMEIHAEREKSLNLLDAIQMDLMNTDTRWGSKNLYLELSRYHHILDNVFKVFQKEEVHIVYYESFFQNVHQSLDQLWQFLNLPAIARQSVNLSTENKGSYSSWLMKRLKQLPGRNLIPANLKSILKSLINSSAINISENEIEYLIPLIKDDLLAMKKDFQLDYYLHYFKKKYNLDIA